MRSNGKDRQTHGARGNIITLQEINKITTTVPKAHVIQQSLKEALFKQYSKEHK
jgi:hypothetical protein